MKTKVELDPFMRLKAEEEYQRKLNDWNQAKFESEMHKAMSRPNKPGYFRANND